MRSSLMIKGYLIVVFWISFLSIGNASTSVGPSPDPWFEVNIEIDQNSLPPNVRFISEDVHAPFYRVGQNKPIHKYR